jgi:hypothetical protein
VEGGLDVREMLDGLAGNDNVERVVGKGEALGVTLNERNRGRMAVVAKLGTRGVERGGGEIAAGDAGAGVGEETNEAAAAAGDFKDAQTGDVTQVFENEAIPGRQGIVVRGISVKDALVPGVVGGAELIHRWHV